MPIVMSNSNNSAKGKRYTEKEKNDILAFVDKVNTEKKRGGQSEAAKKFGISQLTISNWLKNRNLGSPKAYKTSGNSSKLGYTATLQKLTSLAKTIDKAEAELARLKAQFNALKGSL